GKVAPFHSGYLLQALAAKEQRPAEVSELAGNRPQGPDLFVLKHALTRSGLIAPHRLYDGAFIGLIAPFLPSQHLPQRNQHGIGDRWFEVLLHPVQKLINVATADLTDEPGRPLHIAVLDMSLHFAKRAEALLAPIVQELVANVLEGPGLDLLQGRFRVGQEI